MPRCTISGSPLRSTRTRRRSTGPCRSMSFRASFPGEEWQRVESGIIQRITAINLLLDDIYHKQQVLRDGIVPRELILGNRNFRPLMRGIDLPHKTYVNICGTDIVRDEHGAFLVSGGQCADAFGGKLRRRKPPYDAARLSRPARRDRPAPDRELRREVDLRIARSRSRRGCRPAGRAAFSRHLQFGLFRTCLSGPRNGRAAGRGPRPPGRGRSRLHAHDRRARPGST